MKEPSRRRFLQRTAAASIGVAAAGRSASADEAQSIARSRLTAENAENAEILI
jgi:hypothetical protein